MPTKVILGTNNGFAAKNWPEPGEWARLIAQDLGVRSVQFSFDLLDPLLPEPGRSSICEEVIKACGEFGLNLHSTFTGLIIYSQNHLAHPDPILRSQAFSWFQAALEVTTKLGARACGGHIGAMSATDYADPGRRAFIRASLVEYVRKLAGIAASLGQDYFIWELMPHPREIPHTPEEAIDLLAEVNDGTPVPVCVCFDLGHCNSFDLTQPSDPHIWLEKLLPWVKVVHLQQTDGLADHHWPFTPEYNRLGIITPERVVEIVKNSLFPELPLFLELGHAFDASDDEIINDHRCSVDLWMKYL